jgi:hypothetical protein
MRSVFSVPKYRKVIAVDFDGTLSLGKYPACGPANEGLITIIKNILNHNPIERPWLVLWTSREGSVLKMAVDWLAELGIVFDAVNECPKISNFGASRKLPADLYIDDRAMKPEDFIEKIKSNKLFISRNDIYF